MNLDPIIRAVQSKLNLTADGDAGELTWLAIFKNITGEEWNQPAPEPVEARIDGFPSEAIALILAEEGIDQPGKWPGGGSGISLGVGVDIGTDPDSLEFWRGILTDEQIDRLSQAKGKTGRAAAQIASRFADIKVTRAQANQVFAKHTLPREIRLTLRTFPGLDRFPPQVLGALTSLVYNRGAALQGDRRLEMRRIAEIIERQAKEPGNGLSGALEAIAVQFENMKRLWEGQGLNGLLRRRDREAALVRSAKA